MHVSICFCTSKSCFNLKSIKGKEHLIQNRKPLDVMVILSDCNTAKAYTSGVRQNQDVTCHRKACNKLIFGKN